MGHQLPQHVQDFYKQRSRKHLPYVSMWYCVASSEEGKHALTFSVPLQDGLVVSSTTMIPHLEQLGLMYVIFFLSAVE